jgi:DNA-binding HxlR family transcriptional regulator
MPNQQNKKGRSKSEGQYMTLTYFQVHHTAWRSLSGNAVKVFIELRSRYNGGNNRKLRLSLDEGARLLGISKSTVSRAFAELEEKGFIEKTRQGQWYGREATEWRITDLRCDKNLATRDWQNWGKVDQQNSASQPSMLKPDGTIRKAD